MHNSAGEFIGRFINKWRGRTVHIHKHKEDPTKVITIGIPAIGGTPVVCVENLADYTATLQRIKDAEENGRTHIYE